MSYVNEIALDVLVFKTNISVPADLKDVFSILQKETRIRKWNIDTEDIDKVLRVESLRMEPSEIIDLIRQCGFNCEELPD
ncbi:MAG: hypothetical protein C0490_20645 [Marivirga sp.]|nr:hypothetical protein [Marivirga sp.]